MKISVALWVMKREGTHYQLHCKVQLSVHIGTQTHSYSATNILWNTLVYIFSSQYPLVDFFIQLMKLVTSTAECFNLTYLIDVAIIFRMSFDKPAVGQFPIFDDQLVSYLSVCF